MYHVKIVVKRVGLIQTFSLDIDYKCTYGVSKNAQTEPRGNFKQQSFKNGAFETGQFEMPYLEFSKLERLDETKKV